MRAYTVWMLLAMVHGPQPMPFVCCFVFCKTTTTILTTNELNTINNAVGTIYSSTDGFVKGVAEKKTSSTWGLCLRVVLPSGQTKLIKRRGNVQIAAREESSYRVEVEGLIQLYTLLSTHVHTRHACDNEAAVKAHYTTQHHAALGARRWAAVDFRVTLDRLNTAITGRGGEPIDVIHTHSHLENVPTPDPDVHQRRQTLAIADFQANKAHTMRSQSSATVVPPERYSPLVYGPHGPLEKNVGQGALTSHTNDTTNAHPRTTPHGRCHSQGTLGQDTNLTTHHTARPPAYP